MSEENGETKKTIVTMTIEDLLNEGITINTGEDVTVTVIDDAGNISD